MTGIEVKSWEARELERSARLTIVVEVGSRVLRRDAKKLKRACVFGNRE